MPVTRPAGALLPHRFTLTTVAVAVCFLWHCPASHLGLPLAITLLCEVRTFLDPLEAGRGRPANSSALITVLRAAHLPKCATVGHEPATPQPSTREVTSTKPKETVATTTRPITATSSGRQPARAI